MSRKITTEEILRAIVNEREEQMVSVLTDGVIHMPYNFANFRRDMLSSDTCVTLVTTHSKWDALQAQGYVLAKGQTFLDLSRLHKVLPASLRTLLRTATCPICEVKKQTNKNTVNKDARVIQMEGSE